MSFGVESLKLPIANGEIAGQRERLFRETPADTVRRWVLGTAWAMRPHRVGGLPALGRMWFADLLARDAALPDPELALDSPAGLAGFVHELSVPRLVEAYRRGLYPWAHFGPLKWWSPPQRAVLLLDQVHIAKNLRRDIRLKRYSVTFDRDFERVIAACAGRRRGAWHLTWITPRIMRAYAQMFDAGYVHSFEVWNKDGELAGGGYGVAIGDAFFLESLFSAETNTSKIGLAVLHWHLAKWGYAFDDVKLMSPLWQAAGARELPRAGFQQLLSQALRRPGRAGRWQLETDLDTVAAWQPGKALARAEVSAASAR